MTDDQTKMRPWSNSELNAWIEPSIKTEREITTKQINAVAKKLVDEVIPKAIAQGYEHSIKDNDTLIEQLEEQLRPLFKKVEMLEAKLAELKPQKRKGFLR